MDNIDINNYDSINNIVNNTAKKGAEWEKINSIICILLFIEIQMIIVVFIRVL